MKPYIRTRFVSMLTKFKKMYLLSSWSRQLFLNNEVHEQFRTEFEINYFDHEPLYFQTQGIDLQHGVIEYNEQEDGYVLQDLNTAQGTYVNECRVQNATVRLAPGDLLKFGYNGVLFTLEIENPPPVS